MAHKKGLGSSKNGRELRMHSDSASSASAAKPLPAALSWFASVAQPLKPGKNVGRGLTTRSFAKIKRCGQVPGPRCCRPFRFDHRSYRRRDECCSSIAFLSFAKALLRQGLSCVR